MLINSFEFLAFFGAVFLLYYFVFRGSADRQNFLLLISSYFFYGFANLKLLPLLLASTLLFYFLGKGISGAKSAKLSGFYTTIGVVTGLGLLLYFKYTNFFIESFLQLLNTVGFQANIRTLSILIPLGISFYTFRLLSYLIDINRGKIEPSGNLLTFASYIAFFPSLLSGPIDRPGGLIPQLEKKRDFDYFLAVDGLRQVLWGVFKKMVVADNIAPLVDSVWNGYEGQSTAVLIAAALLYTFQMYADFSGYTDMAIGVGKLLGLKITANFNYPLFAVNVADYWRRWHISLTSWLTDYVFMPLNFKFRDLGNTGIILAIIINFILVGFWHGANWTFGLFGLFHGLLFIPLILSGNMNKKTKIKLNSLRLPSLKIVGKMSLTFGLVTIGLLIFRAPSVSDALNYMVTGIRQLDSDLSFFIRTGQVMLMTIISLTSIIIMMTSEWFAFINKQKFFRLHRFGIIVVSMLILFMGSYKDQLSFIYFQF